MSLEARPDEVAPPTQSPSGAETVSPPGEPTFSVDTGSQIKSRSVIHLERRLHTGPLPHPAILREMGEIYPEAPKMIFEDFHAQSSHRREIEKKVIDNRINLS